MSDGIRWGAAFKAIRDVVVLHGGDRFVGIGSVKSIIKAALGDEPLYRECVGCGGLGWTEKPEPRNGGATSYQCRCECDVGYVQVWPEVTKGADGGE